MLTRAYDAIIAASQVPAEAFSTGTDFNNTSLDDSVLNCKNYDGAIRTIMSPSYINSSAGIGTVASNYTNVYTTIGMIPFAYFSQSNATASANYTYVLPDESSATPTYEDYSISQSGFPTSTGWTVASSFPLTISKTYNATTGLFEITVSTHYQNLSGSTKTVYGIYIAKAAGYRSTVTTTTPLTDWFLLCREQFASPVTVPNNSIITLNFTYKVGRQGITGTQASS